MISVLILLPIIIALSRFCFRLEQRVYELEDRIDDLEQMQKGKENEID